MSACPACAYYGSKVAMTRRLNNGWIKRWRKCLQDDCGNRWHTYEVPVDQLDPADDMDLRELKVEPHTQ